MFLDFKIVLIIFVYQLNYEFNKILKILTLMLIEYNLDSCNIESFNFFSLIF